MATFSCGTVIGFGTLAPVHLGLGERLDQRREIGAGVGEQIIDAAIGEQREIGVRHGS